MSSRTNSNNSKEAQSDINKQSACPASLLRNCNEQERNFYRIYEEAILFRHTLLPKERPLMEWPSITSGEVGPGAQGGYLRGPKKIQISVSRGIDRVIAHEGTHFVQDTRGYFEKVDAFVEEQDQVLLTNKSYKNLSYVLTAEYLLSSAFYEPEAYLFDTLFSNTNGRKTFVAMNDGLLGDLCFEGLRMKGCSNPEIFYSVYDSIRKGNISAIPLAVFSSCYGKDSFEHYMKKARDLGYRDDGFAHQMARYVGGMTGVALAALVFVAHDYDEKSALETISSNPKAVVDSVSGMKPESVKSLMRFFERI